MVSDRCSVQLCGAEHKGTISDGRCSVQLLSPSLLAKKGMRKGILILIQSIPPTTVDVERIFKTTKKLENEGRASLSGSTKEMLTVLNLALHEEQPFKPSEK